MSWDAIRGHADQVAMFRRAARRSRLAHAYLFSGPGGIGKKRFALTLAQCLLCEKYDEGELNACGECPGCKQVAARTHPDLIVVGCPEEKAELTIDVFVGSVDRRGREGLCHDLSLRPMMGNRRVAIIDDADLMNEEAANALLKTLEEPAAKSVLILIAENPSRLLPTIRSRCQFVKFAPLSDEDVAKLLMELGLTETPEDARRVASLSGGSLDVAAQLVSPELRQLRETLYSQLADVPLLPLSASETVLNGLDALGGSLATQRRYAQWIVRFCMEFYRGTLRFLTADSPQAETAADRGEILPQVIRFSEHFDPSDPHDFDRLMDLIERTAAADDQLSRNLSIPLCVEALFDDLSRIERSKQQTADRR